MNTNNNNKKSNKKSESGKNQNQISNSPISDVLKIATPISTFPEIQEELVPIEVTYTIDDLIDVWCRGCTNGATLWQYCQDNSYKLPSSFEAGLIELVNEVRTSKDKAQALQAMLNNNMLLLGVFTEKQ